MMGPRNDKRPNHVGHSPRSRPFCPSTPEPESRALRNLRDSITHAHSELQRWRQDGCADRICFWANRVDELLDRMAEMTTRPKQETTAE